MLETIAGGLIVALVSAITFVAYKHPQSYQKFFNPLSTIVLVIWVGRMIYSFAFDRGFVSAVSAVRDLNKDVFLKAPPFPDESFLVSIGLPILVLLWLRFLLFLPSILGLEQDKTSPDRSEAQHKPGETSQ